MKPDCPSNGMDGLFYFQGSWDRTEKAIFERRMAWRKKIERPCENITRTIPICQIQRLLSSNSAEWG